ncbi:potassium-transporting ATPase subunit F [Nocardia thailandica]
MSTPRQETGGPRQGPVRDRSGAPDRRLYDSAPESRAMRGSHVCGGVHGAHRGRVRAARPDPARGGEAVIANLIGLALAAGVAVFLVAALLFPERF